MGGHVGNSPGDSPGGYLDNPASATYLSQSSSFCSFSVLDGSSKSSMSSGKLLLSSGKKTYKFRRNCGKL